jgi:cellulose synthase/poly-beta-1,6-N-acetylglucosamine synthase-like glycosyltransferase
MVIDTLRSLLRIDYPRYEIILIDDNTDDEALWRPVERWCRRHGVKFAHLADWPGYKSGALNYALREMTDPAAEVIGVVDSDYQIEPAFLRRCAPAFAEPWVGFFRAPQDVPRLAARPVLPAAVFLLQVLLRGLPALSQRA